MKRVRIDTKEAGCCGGTAGVVRDATGGRELAVTRPFPKGHEGRALDAAIAEAQARGWTVVP